MISEQATRRPANRLNRPGSLTGLISRSDQSFYFTPHPSRVIFDGATDAANPANRTIAIATPGVTVSDMLVQGAANYTFISAGITADPASVVSGSILTPAAATGKLLKAGTGTLALQNAANNFTDGIELNAGALTLTPTFTATDPNLALAITQGANAAASAITGANDNVTVGSGTQQYAILNGINVIANPGDGNTTVLANTKNNFNGIIRINSGTLQSTALTVAEGRWVARNNTGVPANTGPVTINAGATFQFAGTNAPGAATGFIGSQTFTPSANGSIATPFTGDGTLEITTGQLVFTSANTTIARVNITGSNTTMAIQARAFSI